MIQVTRAPLVWALYLPCYHFPFSIMYFPRSIMLHVTMKAFSLSNSRLSAAAYRAVCQPLCHSCRHISGETQASNLRPFEPRGDGFASLKMTFERAGVLPGIAAACRAAFPNIQHPVKLWLASHAKESASRDA